MQITKARLPLPLQYQGQTIAALLVGQCHPQRWRNNTPPAAVEVLAEAAVVALRCSTQPLAPTISTTATISMGVSTTPPLLLWEGLTLPSCRISRQRRHLRRRLIFSPEGGPTPSEPTKTFTTTFFQIKTNAARHFPLLQRRTLTET